MAREHKFLIRQGVSYFPDQRWQPLQDVTAPVLTGLSLELLEARTEEPDGQPLLLGRQQEIMRHLEHFGLSVDALERVTGFRFYRIVMLPPRQLAPVEQADF